MAGSVDDLILYRIRCAYDDLEAAKVLLISGKFKQSLNRSYYAIFHAVRAVNAREGFDSKKHSGVIAHFNQYHVKNGEFPREASKIISKASNMRENADYEDFFIASKREAEEQLKDAARFLDYTKNYFQMMGIRIPGTGSGDI